VKQVIKMRVLPSRVEAVALYETLRSCNAAALWLSQQMHTTRVFRKIDAQHRFYTELRAGRCGFVGHADHNAAINIASRGVEHWGEVVRLYAAPTLTASEDGSSKPIGDSEGWRRPTSSLVQ
jgi:hypothetical protein